MPVSPRKPAAGVSDEYIAGIIAGLPPLSDAACERIAALLLCGTSRDEEPA